MTFGAGGSTREGTRATVLEIRDEGIAQRYLEIKGTWEDHIRYAMTVEEWERRRDDLMAAWIA